MFITFSARLSTVTAEDTRIYMYICCVYHNMQSGLLMHKNFIPSAIVYVHGMEPMTVHKSHSSSIDFDYCTLQNQLLAQAYPMMKHLSTL